MATSKPKTRHSTGSKLTDLIGAGREFVATECPACRAVIRKGLLLQEARLVEKDVAKHQYTVRQIATDLCPLVLAQWRKSNAKFSPPVIISEESVIRKIEQFWQRASEVAQDRAKQTSRQYVLDRLNKLFDLTNCRHTIFLCGDQGSGCSSRSPGPAMPGVPAMPGEGSHPL